MPADVAATRRAPDLAALLAQTCGVLTVFIGVTALIGWIAGIEVLRRVSASFIPMAPSTALAFVLLGAASFVLERWPERRAARRYVDAAAAFVAALTVLLTAQFIGGFDLGIEAALSSTVRTFLGIQVGRMSPLTGGGFLLAALSLLALTTYPSETAAGRRVAAGMGFGTFAIGVVALAGYVLGAPLFYHSIVIPVALPTATGLTLLGAGVLTTALRGPRRGPAGVEARHRKRSELLRRYLPAVLGSGVTALLALEAAGIARRLDQTRQQEAFASQAREVGTALQSTLDRGLTSIRSIAAAMAYDEGREPLAFGPLARASSSLRSGPVALAWVPRVGRQSRAQFEAAAQRAGGPGFRIWEHGSAGHPVVAGHRDEYLPVSSVEQVAGAAAILGFDVGSDAAAADAIRRARDARTQAVSGAFTLGPGAPGRRVVFVVQPLFGTGPTRPSAGRGGALRGYVIAIFSLADLVRAADSTLGAQGIALTLRDDLQGPPEPLYGRPQAIPADPLLSHAETLEVADRRWRAVFVPTAAYGALHEPWSAWALLAGGLLFAVVIGAHLFGVEHYASDLESARETLRASEARFRAISESAVEGIVTIDAHGTIVHCNPAAVRQFGYADGGLLGRNVRDLVPPSHVAAHGLGLERYRASGEAPSAGATLNLPAKRKDGSEFPVEMSLAVWGTGEGRFATAILRDTSDRERMRGEREQLIAELQGALANVKTLSGLMPICAWCKKIRDDKGYWTQLERYLSDHTGAELSHGMCPDCEQKFRESDL